MTIFSASEASKAQKSTLIFFQVPLNLKILAIFWPMPRPTSNNVGPKSNQLYIAIQLKQYNNLTCCLVTLPAVAVTSTAMAFPSCVMWCSEVTIPTTCLLRYPTLQSCRKGSKFMDSLRRHRPEKLGEPGGEGLRLGGGAFRLSLVSDCCVASAIIWHGVVNVELRIIWFTTLLNLGKLCNWDNFC